MSYNAWRVWMADELGQAAFDKAACGVDGKICSGLYIIMGPALTGFELW